MASSVFDVDTTSAAADAPAVPGTRFESALAGLSEHLEAVARAREGAATVPLEMASAAAVAAMNAVIDLPAESRNALETEGRSAAEAPGPDEIGRALRTLLAHAAVRRRDDWEQVRDALVEAPDLDEDRLHQAHRHAERKRWLIDHVRLLGTAELVALMPDRITDDRNTARVLARWRGEGQVLGVPLKRDWRYPAAQLDERGAVYAALPPVLVRARAAGYDEWEILHWLARARAVPADAVPGRPLDTPDGASLETIATRAAERHPSATPLAAATPSPLERLATDDVDGFERVADVWLG